MIYVTDDTRIKDRYGDIIDESMDDQTGDAVLDSTWEIKMDVSI